MFRNVFQYWNASELKKDELWKKLDNIYEGKLSKEKQVFIIDNLENDVGYSLYLDTFWISHAYLSKTQIKIT